MSLSRVMQTSENRYLIVRKYVNYLHKLFILYFLFSIFSDVNLKSSNKVLKIKYFIVVTFHPNFNKAKTFRAILYI